MDEFGDLETMYWDRTDLTGVWKYRRSVPDRRDHVLL